ncbi:MAG: glycoside hydrolase family 127 protein [Candidatus Phocaeicola faecipullorum]|nr:glycoside hydrolase family 127 protein [Candidatus Phocaeicola faecipullorum]
MNYLKAFIMGTALVAAMAVQAGNEAENVTGNYLNNRQPLFQKDYIELPLGTIKAEGWMQEQLLRMKNGMTGHLDQIYEQVMGPRNGWLGGDGDVWERGPYWIDGLLPLAYLLNDQTLIEKVKPWIEWTLNSQKPNGYFGPDTDRAPERGLQRDNSRDWWPKMVMLKVMQQYYSATGDARVLDFFTKYFKYQLAELPKTPLGHWTFWGEMRGGDNLMLVYWLYNQTGEPFLLELSELIHKQTFNWIDAFTGDVHLNPRHTMHCVNLGQGFKEPAVYFQQSKNPEHLAALDEAVSKIRNTIGLATGLWGGDELIRFGLPTTGSELCTAVEMMYSLEEILEITGNVQWADYLERVAYNALPTQVTDDYSGRQYFQQFNQVSATREWREFSTPHDDTDIVFGVLTGYPCCTSNLHQGWPKFVQNLWYATADNGIAALVYAPSQVKAKVANGIEVAIQEKTNYPFDEKIDFQISYADKKVKEAFFPFHVRIPGWCENPIVKINGKAIEVDAYAGQVARVNRVWKDGDVLTIELPMKVSVSRWYDNGAVVERGPLLYALKMNEKWEKKQMEAEKVQDYGEWYYEVTSDTPWNYALSSRSFDPAHIEGNFIVEKTGKIADYPWNVENAPIVIKTKARRLNNWTEVRGSAGPISFSTQQGNDMGEEETIELIPYGCTTLRIAEFPVRWY